MNFSAPAEAADVALILSLAGSAAAADVVAVVSSRSAVTTLSKAQLTDIFLGNGSRFPNGTQAIPIDQTEGSPARDEFYAKYASKSRHRSRHTGPKSYLPGEDNRPRPYLATPKSLIAANPLAVSYIERGALDSTVRLLLEP